MCPVIRQFDVVEWPAQSAQLIQNSIDAVLLECGRCSVMLTGGRSAERLYTAWAKLPAFQNMVGVQFYFGDERCVRPDRAESNYGLVMRTLFQGGVPRGCSIFRMEADDTDREAAALRYDEVLPDKVDVLLLGVGEDGHVASLFPGSVALREVSRRVAPITGPKPPYERLTITPPVIAQARSIFVLAVGVAKAQVLAKAQHAVGDFDTLPARLILNATWMLDLPTSESYRGSACDKLP